MRGADVHRSGNGSVVMCHRGRGGTGRFFEPGEYYYVHINKIDNNKSEFAVERVSALETERMVKRQKLVSSFAAPKESKWGYHNIDLTAATPLEGKYEDEQGFLSFWFVGNYLQYINLGGMTNISLKYASKSLSMVGGLFEISGNKIILYRYAENLLISNPKRERIGWFRPLDIMDEHKTEEFTYELNGDTLTINGMMGLKVILHKKP
jgi:hypothetical protein